MKLNRIEKVLMNNPVRAVVQAHYEATLFERIGGRLDGMRVLEIGCGRGVGAEILLDRLGAKSVHAYDLDIDMVSRASRRLARYPPGRAHVAVADASKLPATSASFDAVVDFGAIHHVPDWRMVVREVRRVLRPGGRFYFEEVTRRGLERWFYRIFLEHPRKDRFTAAEFVAELDRNDINVNGYVERWLGDFVIGVGTVPLSASSARSQDPEHLSRSP